MNDPITLNSLGQMLGILVLLGGLWWRVETRISTGAIQARAKADEALEKINSFRLEVAEHYAKMAFIKDIETRILEELQGMRKDFHEAVVLMAKSGPRARSQR